MVGATTLRRVIREIGCDVAAARDRDPAARGHDVDLFGPPSGDASPWPDVAEAVAKRVSQSLPCLPLR